MSTSFQFGGYSFFDYSLFILKIYFIITIGICEAIVSNPDGSQRSEILGRLFDTLLERERMDLVSVSLCRIGIQLRKLYAVQTPIL